MNEIITPSGEVFYERAIEGVTDPAWMANHLDRYRFASRFVEGASVLDAACGTGYGSNLLAHSAARVVGVDLSSAAVDYAASRYGRANLSFKVSDVCAMRFDERFDAVVSFETIEHLPDVPGFLECVGHGLKENGLFIVSTPWREAERPANPHHMVEWTRDEFEVMLGSRFGSVESYVQDPHLRFRFGPIRLSRRIPRRFLRRIQAEPDPSETQHSTLRGIYAAPATRSFWLQRRSSFIVCLCRGFR